MLFIDEESEPIDDITDSNIATDIDKSCIDLQPNPFDPDSSLSYQSNNAKTNHQLDFHDYDNFTLTQKNMTDIISAHRSENITASFLKKDITKKS